MIRFERSLVWIDDRTIRREAFSKAEKLIRRLERVERDLESFESEDQRLYQNWFELTFRVELARIRDANAELRRLQHFHNWMVAEHHRLDIPVADAYRILKEEEEFYKVATGSERAAIDRERAAREDFLREMMRKEEATERKREERARKKEEKDLDECNRLYAEAAALSEEELEQRLSRRSPALEWLSRLLNGARMIEHLLIWERVWDQVPGSLKGEFKRLMVHGYGVDLDRVLADIESHLERHRAREAQRRRMEQRDPDNEILDGEENLRQAGVDPDDARAESFGADAPPAGSRGERDELIKIIYRKLVRRLHPDLNGGGQSEVIAWQKSIWQRVQDAHESKDLSLLERLHQMVLIRGRELSEVTIGEILESHQWLEKEYERLNSTVRQIRQAPAWGFSRRKDYGPLERKVVKTIHEDLAEIDGDLREMQEQFEMLDALLKGDVELERNRSFHGRSARKKRKSTSRVDGAKKPKSRARRRR